MADNFDMGLDEIIKAKKKLGVGRGARGGGGGRGGGTRGRGRARGGRGGRAAGAGGQRGRSRSRSRPVANQAGGQMRGRSRSRSRVRGGGGGGPIGGGRGAGGGRGGIRRARSRSRSAVRRDPTRNVNAPWQHDRYVGGGRPQLTTAGPGKLMVSNLDFGVSDNDIEELFAEFGKLRSAAVHYDRSGRSLGTADVVFERRSDAIKALKQYDGVPLDGRPMKIEMASDASQLMNPIRRPRSASVPRRRGAGGRIGRRGGRGGRGGGGPTARRRGAGGQNRRGAGPAGRRGGGGRGRGRGRGGAKKQPAVKPNKEQLDQELDTFMKER